MVRRKSRNRRERLSGQSGSIVQMAFKQLKNPYSPIEVLSSDQIEAIHHASLRILKEIGLQVADGDSRARLKAAGCDVNESTCIVRFDPELVEEMITGLPAEYKTLSRNPEKNLTVGGNNIVFSSVADPSFVTDIDRGRRAGTYSELCDFVKVSHCLNIIHQDGGQVLNPSICHRQLDTWI